MAGECLHMDNNYYLKKQLIQEIEEAIRIKELNMEFMEQNTFLSRWLLNYCAKNNIEAPNLDRLQELVQKGIQLVQKMYKPYRFSSPKNKHPDKTPKDSTEPFFSIS